MDIEKVSKDENHRKLRIIAIVSAVTIIIVLMVVFISSNSGPEVDKENLWIGVVKRGRVVFGVDGTGKLIPEITKVIPARTGGRVEQITAAAGAEVNADSTILLLSNEAVKQAARDAQWKLRAMKAGLKDLKARLNNRLMDLQAESVQADADNIETQALLKAKEQLFKEGLVSKLSIGILKAQADANKKLAEWKKRRVKVFRRSISAQIEAQEAKLSEMKEQALLRNLDAKALDVKAGIKGVLQEISVEAGQQVVVGAVLAKVIQPGRLKASLKVPANQAKYLKRGQEVLVHTHDGQISGVVSGFVPAVKEGTIGVDVSLTGHLPKGARPDEVVTGTIVLEKPMNEVLYIPHPANVKPETTASLFKLSRDGSSAVRVTVTLGKGSEASVQVLKGLKKGDKVILSDMSEYRHVNKIQLH